MRASAVFHKAYNVSLENGSCFRVSCTVHCDGSDGIYPGLHQVERKGFSPDTSCRVLVLSGWYAHYSGCRYVVLELEAVLTGAMREAGGLASRKSWMFAGVQLMSFRRSPRESCRLMDPSMACNKDVGHMRCVLQITTQNPIASLVQSHIQTSLNVSTARLWVHAQVLYVPMSHK